MTMPLDGFVADKNGSLASLYPDLAALRETEFLQEAIGIMPRLLGDRLRFFERGGTGQIELERTRIIESGARMDITFRGVK